MFGSSRWNSAHDLERKLGPWKQASVMWLPWRLIEPPSWTASSGRGIWKREMWQPAMTLSTPGQWRWWAASMSVTQRQAGVDCKQTNQSWPQCEPCCWQDPILKSLINLLKCMLLVLFVCLLLSHEHVWLHLAAEAPRQRFEVGVYKLSLLE